MRVRAAIALVVLCLAAGASPSARANGRFPASVNVRFQPGATDTILAPATFGLLISHDDGATFHWVCEDGIGYSGIYDPDYAVAGNGDIYATTFEGLRVSSDGGCTFETIGPPLDAEMFISEVEIGPDGRIWVATATGGAPNDVYVASDGRDFASAGLLDETAWWSSLRVAPGDPDRIYVSGLRQATATEPAAALLRRSIDGGVHWEELSVGDFIFADQKRLFILGVSPVDPDVVFARVEAVRPPQGDALYRSDDGGMTWVDVLDMADAIGAFLIRQDGDTVIAGTVGPCPGESPAADKGCVRISRGGGPFLPAASEPRMACLAERSDGTLYACGSNWRPDLFALARSRDGESWEPVLRFRDIAGPLECAAGTDQHDICELVNWAMLCDLIEIDACTSGDMSGDSSNSSAPGEASSCGVGGADGGDQAAALFAVLGVVWLFRMRVAARRDRH